MQTLVSGSVLSGHDIFIGGPIQHAILPDGFLSNVRLPISHAIEAVSMSGARVFSAHVNEGFGEKTVEFTPSQVSRRDFRWMKKCDVFVPVLPLGPSEDLVRTDGTHIELGWASAMGRPIVLVTRTPIADSASHLLKGLVDVANVSLLDLGSFVERPWSLG